MLFGESGCSNDAISLSLSDDECFYNAILTDKGSKLVELLEANLILCAILTLGHTRNSYPTVVQTGGGEGGSLLAED